MTEATPTEQMIVAAARTLAGVRTVFVGVGMPNVACNLARLTVSPDLELIYESGVYGARPARLPLSIGDPTLVSGATAAVAMADLFGLYLQGGHIAEIAANARRVLIMMRLGKRSFVERLDFVTSAAAGVHHAGPELVVTDLGLLDFATPEREMQLISVHAGISVEQVRDAVGWDLRYAPSVAETPAPTADELRLLREELDPTGLYRR
jgi:glutaconate CoA-transferase subunit B